MNPKHATKRIAPGGIEVVNGREFAQVASATEEGKVGSGGEKIHGCAAGGGSARVVVVLVKMRPVACADRKFGTAGGGGGWEGEVNYKT